MKLLYKPFAITAGLLGARAGRRAFSALWSRVSAGPKPTPGAPDSAFTGVVLAAALEGATLGATAAAVEFAAARVFHQLMGAWPEPANSDGHDDSADL